MPAPDQALVGPPVQLTAPRVRVPPLKQVGALVKKNWKIHVRANGCPCCPCLIINGKPLIGACCCHCFCPIFFVVVLTFVPWLIAKLAMSEANQKLFLEPVEEPGTILKPWFNFGTSSTDMTFDSGVACVLYGWESCFQAPPPPDERPVGNRPMLDVLFRPSVVAEIKRDSGRRMCVNTIKSCFCSTVALVGPEPAVSQLKAFLEEKYRNWQTWQAGLDNMTNVGIMWMMEYNLRGHDPASLPGLAAAAGKGGGGGGGVGKRRLSDPLQGGPVPASSVIEEPEAWWEAVGRRLQMKPPSDGAECDTSDPARYCDVDAGHTGTIFRKFSSKDAVDKWIDSEDYGQYDRKRSETSSMDRLCSAIYLDNDVLSTSTPQYTIRLNVTQDTGPWAADSVKDDLTKVNTDPRQFGTRIFSWYMNSGFLAWQQVMHTFLLASRAPSAVAANATGSLGLDPHFIAMPSRRTRSWAFGILVEEVLGNPFILSCMFGPILASIAFYTARERQTRQRELMRMMGLGDGALMWSWVLMYALCNLFITLVQTIFFIAFFFLNTDFFLLWMALWTFSNAVTTFGMFVAGIVTSDRLAAQCAFGLFFAVAFISTAITESTSEAGKYLVSLLPPDGFMIIMSTVWSWETEGSGNSRGNMYSKLNNYSFAGGIWMQIFDFWLYLFLYYWFDQCAFWHQVGVARKPWFLFTPLYWREFFGLPPVIAESTEVIDVEGASPTSAGQYLESEDEARLKHMLANKQAVTVKGLCKSFRNSSGELISAVDNLNMNMYQDECFCLLGHNGAGKTTTMMMITGCLPQTKGSIKVKGRDVPMEIRQVRTDMGFCPQHNVLIDELTVFEHLDLFGTIGGMSKESLKKRGTELLAAVALLDKIHARSSSLSGGMKRKLSCALAFLAEPYLVILDEPSSGMDPFARRGMWDTLKRWRTGHIICLTTHYMDEADALGDRIAIMSDGKVACSGSSTFLKKSFGCGYVIAFVKASDGRAKDDTILDCVRGVVGDQARVMSTVGRELLIEVPFAASVKFPELFPKIDHQREALGIEAYGTSVTNLEEVFLKVAKMHRKKPIVKDGPVGSAALDVKTNSHASLGRQVYALLIRRFKFGYRNKLSCCFQIGMPCCCLMFFMLIIVLTLVTSLPALELDTSAWNEETGSGPKNPLTVAYRAGVPSIEEQAKSVWQSGANVGFDRVDLAAVTPAEFPPAAYLPPPEWSTVKGLLEEGGFQRSAVDMSGTYEASQYGAIYYPAYSPWCPSEMDNMCPLNPGITVAANLSAAHSAPVLFNAHAGAYLASRTKGSARPVESVKVSNHPFQYTSQQRLRAETLSGFFAALIIMASYGFIPAGATTYVVMEREKDVKNQLIISGCSYLAYWIANFIFDILWGMIPIIGAWIVFKIYGLDNFTESVGRDASCALFLVYLPAMAGFAYLFSFMFSKAGIALFVSWIFNMLFGILGTTIIFILYLIPNVRGLQVALRWIFRFVPIFSLGYGHLTIISQKTRAEEAGIGALTSLDFNTGECPDGVTDSTRDSQCTYMVGSEFFALVVSGFVYVLAAVLFDVALGSPRVKQMLSCFSGSAAVLAAAEGGDPRYSGEDEMVKAEKTRVEGVNKATQFVYVRDIHKVYAGGVHAVRGVSFAADEGQVFGLLGVNGAGKTTTFKMLCGQVEPTKGEVVIQGINVSTNPSQARKHIGYCPQFDALLDSLTTEEHLYLYGRLKGLSKVQLKEAVQACLGELDLMNYVRSRAGQLSGGNKRKLSVGMATIGEPPMVFLDEPSAGMDPLARRSMWTVVQNIAEKRKKSVVILTTHSMEEAEALCSRIAIQVDGKFRCLGSAQQIKSKYGQGLELNVRLTTPSQEELIACCVKLGGNPTDIVTSTDAAAKVEATLGKNLALDLAARAGSPLAAGAGTSLSVLSEWALLSQRMQDFEAFVGREFSSEASVGKPLMCSLEKSQNVVRYQIFPAALEGKYKTLGAVFSLFEEQKASLHLEDFQVCQPSLEQIFNRFATTQASVGAAAATLNALNAANAPAAASTAPPPPAEEPFAKEESAAPDWPRTCPPPRTMQDALKSAPEVSVVGKQAGKE